MIDEGLKVLSEVSLQVTTEEFYRPEHKRIYAAMLRLYADGVQFNVLSIEAELEKTDEMKLITRQYLLSLMNLEYTTARATWYAAQIKEAALLRRLEELGREISDDAKNERGTSAEISAKFSERLTREIDAAQGESVREISERVMDDLRLIWNNPDMRPGIDTGFFDLDNLTGGFKNSDLTIIAARPSVGKTAFALSMALHTSKKVPTLIFSLEMSKAQLVERLLSSLSKVPLNVMKNGNLITQGAISAVFEAYEDLAENHKLIIDDTGSLKLTDLCNRARRAKRQGCGIIFIDYLQLMQGSKVYKGNRVQEVSELSRGLKVLARELEVPIITLSQLSRQTELRADKRPLLADLRDSGAIEQDADVVMMLYREKYYNKDATFNLDEGQEQLEVTISKNRNGATGKINLIFEPSTQLIKNYTRRV